MALSGRSKIRGLVMLPALFALVAGISPMAQAQDEQPGLSAPVEGALLTDTQRGLASRIEGSWVFTIADPTEGPFYSLISFTAGGVVITSSSLPGPGVLYGSWKQRGPNCFNAAFYGFISDAAGNGVSNGASGVATIKASLQVHLTSRNELAGTAVGYTCDLQAENCVRQAGDAKFTGKRILPE